MDQNFPVPSVSVDTSKGEILPRLQAQVCQKSSRRQWERQGLGSIRHHHMQRATVFAPGDFLEFHLARVGMPGALERHIVLGGRCRHRNRIFQIDLKCVGAELNDVVVGELVFGDADAIHDTSAR